MKNAACSHDEQAAFFLILFPECNIVTRGCLKTARQIALISKKLSPLGIPSFIKESPAKKVLIESPVVYCASIAYCTLNDFPGSDKPQLFLRNDVYYLLGNICQGCSQKIWNKIRVLQFINR